MDYLRLDQVDERLRDRVLAASGRADVMALYAAGEGLVVDALTGDRVVHMQLELRPDDSVAEATETFLVHQVLAVREGEDGLMVADFADGARRGSVPLAPTVAQGVKAG